MALLPRNAGRTAFLLAALLLTGKALATQGAGGHSGGRVEAPFLAENEAAMTRMMNGMAIKPSGDVDADFGAMMIAHHQGAIEMAEAELRHGHNAILRRLAQEIVVEQGQEITAMRLAIGQPRAASSLPAAQIPTPPAAEPTP